MGWNIAHNDNAWSKFINDDYPHDILLGFEYEIDNDVASPKNQELFFTKLPVNDWEDHKKNPKTNRLPWAPLPKEYRWHYEGMNRIMGVEVCSPVMPLRDHRKTVPLFLNSEIPFNRKPNGKDNGGGIHVSIDAAGPAKDFKNKVFKFLHTDISYKYLLRISKRSSDQYNTWCRQRPGDENSHYGVINNENKDRYEFRLFAAHPDLLMPALEMADSLFCSAKMVEELTLDTYRQYIDNKLRYRSIRNHLNEVL
jgi:hypothetical protein